MIAYIKGTVESIELDKIIVECSGIGYDIYFAHIGALSMGQQIQVYIYQHIREDENTLYGFLSKADKELFMKLLSVKGVGPKTILSIFKAAKYETIVTAIEQEDVAFIKSMPGIGAKTASQIILDLKGKLVATNNGDASDSTSKDMKDALEALKSLGFKQNEINQIQKYLVTLPKKSTDEYVKIGLQFNMSAKR